MRAKFQVLVVPYCMINNKLKVCIFKRKSTKVWQFIAGGGEDDESEYEAALREFREETHITCIAGIEQLDTSCSIPTCFFKEKYDLDWEKDCYVIPEKAFSYYVCSKDIFRIQLSSEHIKYKWTSYEKAMKLLYYDSNKTALWELRERIRNTKNERKN